MSIAKQIAAKNAKIAKLQAEVEAMTAKVIAGANAEAFVPGVTVITFTVGKGEKQRVLTGKVLGVKRADKGGTVVKAMVGEGADTAVVGLFPSQIITVE